MGLIVNNTEVENVIVNGKDCNKVVCNGVTVFEKSAMPEAPTDCIMFVGEESDFTLTATNKEWDGTVEYSTDKSIWTEWDGTAISSAGSKLYLRGSGNTKFYTLNGARLSLSSKAGCYGNIQTLLQYDNPPTRITASYCYYDMFYGCTNLTQAPELPATTLANFCYSHMFDGCTGLTQAPELPATTLASYCYSNMFYGCTGLTQAPELPATALAGSCYRYMFDGCTNIKLSTTQDSTYKTPYRIPTTGTGTIATEALKGMFSNTGGSFTGTPTINTTYYGAWEKQSTESAVGAWTFKSTLTAPTSSFSYDIDFTSDGNEYDTIIYLFSATTPIGLCYGTTSFQAYTDATSAWTDEMFKTITITGGADATNSEFITWLKANATKSE